MSCSIHQPAMSAFERHGHCSGEVMKRASRALDESHRIGGEVALSDQEENGIGDLIVFLARCGKPETVNALKERYCKCDDFERQSIVQSLGDLKDDCRKTKYTLAYQAAVDDLLVQAMFDSAVVFMSRGGDPAVKAVNDPTIGDLAAEILAVRWENARCSIFPVGSATANGSELN